MKVVSRLRLAIACAGIAFACRASPPMQAPVESPAPRVDERDEVVSVSVLVRGDTGLWERETRDVRLADMASEYVTIELLGGTQLDLFPRSVFTRRSSGCFATFRDESGLWSLDSDGVRLHQSARKVAGEESAEILALAVVGDAYALVPADEVGSFIMTGPTRTNCLMSLREPWRYWSRFLRSKAERR